MASLFSTYVRAVEASQRHERFRLREARRKQQALAAMQRQRDLEWERQMAFAEKACQQAYLAAITSIHRWCRRPINWESIAKSPEPQPPAPFTEPPRDEVDAAQRELDAYAGGALDGLGVLGKKGRLERKVAKCERLWDQALEQARAAHARRTEEWQQDLGLWRLAHGLLGQDEAAYRHVVTRFRPFEELEEVARIGIGTIDFRGHHCRVRMSVPGDHGVPAQLVDVTPGGRRTVAPLSQMKRNDLYQDYACGCALRAARELHAALPLYTVQVDVAEPVRNTVTGHIDMVCILSVVVPREVQFQVNWAYVDASDLVENLSHRMDFGPRGGFRPVSPL